MNEPTYSQIEAACQAMWGNDHPEFYNRDLMKAALIAAQGVDQNIYGHMHYGYSCDGVTLMTDSLPSRDRIAYWHHLAETTIPYHEKHTIPELKRLREQVAALDSRAGDAGEGDDPDHQYAVVSANYARPFLAGAYPTLDAALLAQDGKPDRWHIYRRLSATPAPAVDAKNLRDGIDVA